MKTKPIISAATIDRFVPDHDSRFALATLLLVLVVAQLAGFHVLGIHAAGLVSP